MCIRDSPKPESEFIMSILFCRLIILLRIALITFSYCFSYSGNQGAQSAAGSAARHGRAAGMFCRSLPQHHQLLGEEQRRDVARRVS